MVIAYCCHVVVCYLCTVSTSLLVLMWGRKSTSAIIASHTGRSIGRVIGPLVTIPFLSDETQNHHNILDQSNGSIVNNTSESYEYTTQVHIPYIIGACVLVPVAVNFLLCSLCCKQYLPTPEDKTDQQGNINNNDDDNNYEDNGSYQKPSDRFSAYWFTVVIGGFLFYFLISTNNYTMYFFPSIAVESSLAMSQQDAAIFSIAVLSARTAGRFLSTFIARCLSPHFILFGSTFISLIHLGSNTEKSI